MNNIEFTFDNDRKITFNISQKDMDHFGITGHRMKMQEWVRPLSNSAYISEEVYQSFPFYTLKCRDCDFKGDDYNKDGSLRNKNI